MMRVLLADDSAEVRAALRLVIEHQPGCAICGEAVDTVHLLGLCVETCPDAVILDAELAGLPDRRRAAALGELARTLRRLCPQIRLVALSSNTIPRDTPWLASVDACFSKSDPPDDLLAFLRDRAV